MNSNRFWWVRHAPVINNNNCCYGNNEVDCDISDKDAFFFLSKTLPKNSYVYSSALKRAIKTFDATCKSGYKYKTYEKDNAFAEQDIGNWAGMSYPKLEKETIKLNVYSPNWLCKSNYIPPKGESLNDVYTRVTNKINFINNNFINSDIVIFSHGGPIRTAIALATGGKLEHSLMFQIDNLSITRIDFVNTIWKVQYINLSNSIKLKNYI